jgi:hypothetical protein
MPGRQTVNEFDSRDLASRLLHNLLQHQRELFTYRGGLTAAVMLRCVPPGIPTIALRGELTAE